MQLSKNLFEPFESSKSQFFCKALHSYNLPAARARELFKPSTDSANLLVEIKKNFSLWIWVFFEETSQ